MNKCFVVSSSSCRETTIYDKIEAGNYKNSDSYPVKPSKPSGKPSGALVTSADYKRHAEALEVYESAMITYKAEVIAWLELLQEWQTKQHELNKLFDKELLEEVFSESDRKLYKNTIAALYAEAYERGHSGGHSEIATILFNLSAILEDVKKDVKEQ